VRSKGKIKSWNDRKGYGFITPDGEDNQVFVHISAFADRKQRPIANQEVSFVMSTDKQGRPCAADVSDSDQKGRNFRVMAIVGGVLVIVALALGYFGIFK
jgi:cold shock CspA family protein